MGALTLVLSPDHHESQSQPPLLALSKSFIAPSRETGLFPFVVKVVRTLSVQSADGKEQAGSRGGVLQGSGSGRHTSLLTLLGTQLYSHPPAPATHRLENTVQVGFGE